MQPPSSLSPAVRTSNRVRQSESSASAEAPAFHDAGFMIELLDSAAEANLQSQWRQGATVHLPLRGQLVMTGDLHDHGLNLQRIIHLARLEANPDHHLVLHEVIHGPQRIHGRDLSILTLARVAALKVQFPEQVHVIQSNHELAQLGGEGICKAGVNVVEAFMEGLDFIYEAGATGVSMALDHYIRSLPLAVKCANGIFCSHSLPSMKQVHPFDPGVIHRHPTDDDLKTTGSAYQMVWGRNHSQEVADALAQAWDAQWFLMGHQPVDMGYEVQGRSMLILASNHDHGMALPMNLSKGYTMEELIDQVVPLAGIAA